MAGELHDNAEKQTLSPVGVQSDAASLSQNTQTLFTPLSDIRAASELPQSLDFGSLTNIYGTDNVIAQNYQDVRQSGLSTDIVRVALPPEIDIKGAVYKAEHPYRGEIDKTMARIPEQAWQQAFDTFPQLQTSGLSREQTVQLMQALVRNELYNYNSRDLADDRLAKLTGNAPDWPGRPSREATLGVSQVSPKGIDDMAKEFPEQMSKYVGKEVHTLLDPKEAPMLVAANLAHNIEMYRRHGIPISSESLAYGFNPREKGPDGKTILLPDQPTLARAEHVKNVMHQLDIVRGKIAPTAAER